MTTTASTPGPQRSDASRRRTEPQPGRGRERLSAVLALGALVLLVIGLPLLLASLVGWPLPDHVPTGSELLRAARAPISDTMVVKALACLFWLAWLQVVACVLVEARAAITGVGVPRAVPLSGWTQQLTRRLVSTVLLFTTATAVLSPVTGALTRAALPERGAKAVATAPRDGSALAGTVVGPAGSAGARPVTHAAPTSSLVPSVGPADEADATRPAGELAGRKVMVVVPPNGRHHMSLWELAETHLGDGTRYREIYRLNEGRPQPDGGTLVLARLIQPGWQLLMPDDAVDVPTVPVRPVRPVQPSEPSERSEPATPAAPTAAAAQPAADGATALVRSGAGVGGVGGVVSGVVRGSSAAGAGAVVAAPSTAVPGASTAAEAGSSVSETAPPGSTVSQSVLVSWAALLEAGLLSAGLLASLRTLRTVQQRRRREQERLAPPAAELLAAELALRLGEQPEAVAALDAALRGLSAQQQASGAPLPDVLAAVVDDDAVRLVLRAPTRPVPAPFVAVDPAASSWQAPRSAVAAAPDAHALSPYPALVSLGRDEDGGRLLLDLESAGVLVLSGPRRVTTAALRALAVELATSGWADHLTLTLVGFGAELVALQPARVRHVDTLADALPGLESGARALADGPERAAAVLASRSSGGDPLLPEVVLLAEQVAPTAGELARLQTVARSLSGRTGLALVTSEDVADARWTARLAPDGSAAVEPLGVRLAGRGLDDEAWAAICGLVAAACSERTVAVNARGAAELLTGADAVSRPSESSAGDTGAVSGSPDASAVEAAGASRPADGAADRTDLADGRAPARGDGEDAPATAPAGRFGRSRSRREPGLREAATTAAGEPSLDSRLRLVLGPPPDEPTDPAAFGQVRLLGPVEVTAPGLSAPPQAGCTELVVLLALHPGGRTLPQIAAALFPRMAPGEGVRDAQLLLARTRAWLGSGPDGVALVPQTGPDETVRLGPDLELDVDVFRRAAAKGRLSDHALELLRGPVLSGLAPRRYSWLVELDLERDLRAEIIDAVLAETRARRSGGAAEDARDAAAAGLRAEPLEERLWRELLLAESELGHRDRVAELADELADRVQRELGGYDALQPETEQLLAALLPRHRTAVSS